MNKLNIQIQIELDTERMEDNNISIEDIKNQLMFIEDEVLDGHILTRRSDDNAEEFYIKNISINK